MTPDEWDDPKLWDVPDRDVRWPAERCPGSDREPFAIDDFHVCPECRQRVDTENFIDRGGIPTEFVVAKEHTR